MKFVVVSGGVLSGLGKGITASSIGLILKSKGFKVTAIKCDMYLNVDAGTMNPIEHGEVFVTHDGLETDQDLGHYERFMDVNLTKDNYLTSGQVYKIVLEKERSLEYNGECVQPYHHIPPEIIDRWHRAGTSSNSDIVIVELGGTVGEYEGLLFFEAVRRLKLSKPKDVILIHVGYLPAPPSIGELKSKPMQQSITTLYSLGVHPDLIVCRAEGRVDNKRKEKIALASGLSTNDIVANPDLESIYEVPVVLEEQNVSENILGKLGLKHRNKDLKEWRKFVENIKHLKEKVNIGIVGKYQNTGDYTLEDSYVCVVEALKHASWRLGVDPNITWVDSEKLENMSEEEIKDKLSMLGGLIVPQGWGSRGTEGKIKAIKYARENDLPYLGLCFGMQMAVIEFARNVLGLKDASSEEINPKSKHPVIHTMDDQKKYLESKNYGGTIRLGAWPCKIVKSSILEEIYKKHKGGLRSPWYQKRIDIKTDVKPKKGELVFERHRHRYEFNNKYKKRIEAKGMMISGTSPDGKLVEAVSIKDHKYFVGVQFHPEYLSRPLNPHPVFQSFIDALI